jgi:hypothetical protein
MHPIVTRISLRSLFSGLAALAVLGVAAPAFSQSPANDLTITVNELPSGDVKFTASGTSQMLMSGSFYTTNASTSAMIPPQNRPLNLPQYYEMPVGLIFTYPVSQRDAEEESAPEEGPSPGYGEFPLNYLFFNSGFWHMGSYSSGFLEQGAPITGSGTVTVSKSDIAFTDFVPGTFHTRTSPWSMGEELYDLTYKVIPYTVGLGVEKPARFSETQVNRSSQSQVLTITNLGSLPISGLTVQISQSGKKNFKVTQPKLKELKAGESTTFEATFNPDSAGNKATRITVTDGTSLKKVTLKGRGVDNRVNSPRFPASPGN